jgi:hypothetical protein
MLAFRLGDPRCRCHSARLARAAGTILAHVYRCLQDHRSNPFREVAAGFDLIRDATAVIAVDP